MTKDIADCVQAQLGTKRKRDLERQQRAELGRQRLIDWFERDSGEEGRRVAEGIIAFWEEEFVIE